MGRGNSLRSAWLVLLSVFSISNIGFAQQWNGSATATGDIYRAGRVAIGIANPQRQLHIHKPTVDFVTMRFTHANSPNGGFNVGLGGHNNGLIRLREMGAIRFYTQNVEVMRIDSVGNVGIGTTDPQVALDVEGHIRIPANRMYQVSSLDALGWDFTTSGLRVGSGAMFSLSLYSNSATPSLFLDTAGNVGVGMTSPGHPLEMASGAHVTTGGVWTNASSRAYKENIHHLSPEMALAALEKLQPVQFNYKTDGSDEYVGFIAEDVPDLVASKDHKGLSSMDIVAVLTKVVQQQQKQIADLKARLDEMQ